jgi:hypothetical protein
VTRLRKGGDHTLAALKSIRAARPDGAPIYVRQQRWGTTQTQSSVINPGQGSWTAH